jgi:hypothetical protein
MTIHMTDEDLVIIGSGYLDIKNKFKERPSQTNSEYAEDRSRSC